MVAVGEREYQPAASGVESLGRLWGDSWGAAGGNVTVFRFPEAERAHFLCHPPYPVLQRPCVYLLVTRGGTVG